MPSCPSCGKEIGSSTSYCPHCGQSLVPVPDQVTQAAGGGTSGVQAEAPTSTRGRKVAAIVLIIILAAGGLVFLAGGSLFHTQHTVVVASGPGVVPPAFYTATAFTVPSGVGDPVLTGSFTAGGDFNNQITVLLMSQGDFASWQNGVAVAPYYSSGQVSGANVNVPLVAGQSYVLVFWNTFSTVSATNVYGTLSVTYST